MKRLIAELDKISAYLEDFEEPWTYTLVWKLDRIAQELEERQKNQNKLSKVAQNVLDQYVDSILFLDKNNSSLIKKVKKHASKKASIIYKELKEHFGKLSRKESIVFIKNVLKKI